MIKNIYIKKALKSTIFKVLTQINKVIPKDDKFILLYTANKGISFNLKPLCDYLIAHNYNEKYQIICGIENLKYKGISCNNLKYVSRFKSIYYFLRSVHVFYTAGQIPIKPSKRQIVIHMRHGAANFKATAALTNINNGDEFFFTYMVAPSPIYIPIDVKEYKCSKRNIIICGEPMTDVMFGQYKKYDLGKFKKIFLWTPTFRQSDYLGYDDSTQEALLPMFDESEFEELNEKLKLFEYKMMVKLHPAQKLDSYQQLFFSNLEIYSHDDFERKGYNLYELMPQIDILVADYSSTFLQFLLLDNKQLIFVIPDYDEYKQRRGFEFENPKEYMPGDKIHSKQQLYHYFEKLQDGVDEYRLQREKVKSIIHKYQDGENCKRILEASNVKK